MIRLQRWRSCAGVPIMLKVKVNLQPPSEPYSIVIEARLLSRVGEQVRSVAPHARCMLVMDANVVEPHGRIVEDSLRGAGYEVATTTLTADEKHKTLASVEHLYHPMLAARLERRSPVIALGGGIVGDIAGYAAATYLRGVPLIHVPTTLLAMVDASIGGKTGVNFPLPHSQDLGKNLTGAFWQPKAVLIDPMTLLTLQRREFACGLAECIKHAVIADASLLGWIGQRAAEIEHRHLATLEELIAASASIKAAIVAEDEREHGRRALLNLGHTFAHAIETVQELQLLHGEAVAIGMRAAMYVAVGTGRMKRHEQQSVHEVISRCGLPSRLPHPADIERLLRAMAFDKKSADGKTRLILPRGIGAAEIVEDVPMDLVREAWLDIGAAA
jgi:3-dehydroquinate synthase